MRIRRPPFRWHFRRPKFPYRKTKPKSRNSKLDHIWRKIDQIANTFDYIKIGSYLAHQIGRGMDREILRIAISQEQKYYEAGLDRVLVELKKKKREDLVDQVFREFHLDEMNHIELAYDYGTDKRHWAKLGIQLGIKFSKPIPTVFFKHFLSDRSYKKLNELDSIRINSFDSNDFNATLEHLEEFITLGG